MTGFCVQSGVLKINYIIIGFTGLQWIAIDPEK